MSVAYGRYEEAFKAIHSALSDLMAAPLGKRIGKVAFTWNLDGTIATLKAYDGTALLFTLSFIWNADGTLKEVSRSDA
jgi:hypothetical protein